MPRLVESPRSRPALAQPRTWRDLPEGVRHQVVDQLRPRDQARLIVADRDTYQLSRKVSCLDAKARRERFLATDVRSLADNAQREITELAHVIRLGVSGAGVLWGARLDILQLQLGNIRVLFREQLAEDRHVERQMRAEHAQAHKAVSRADAAMNSALFARIWAAHAALRRVLDCL